MSLVRVHNFSVSLDGFGTGDGQSREAPFGHAGDRLHRWFIGTRSFRAMGGNQGGSTGIDDAFASNWGPGIGAEIMGRNKFDYERGPWTDTEWKGWWGEEPPFHTPVFVLTHHVRPSIEMKGGTTFHFIDASPAQALAAARQAAGGLDQFREIAAQRLSALRLQQDFVAGAKHEAAEAIPLGLILPLRSFRKTGRRRGFHRWIRLGNRQRHQRLVPTFTSTSMLCCF